MLKNKIKKYPIISFFILTFLISWIFWILQIFLNKELAILRIAGTFAPFICSIIVTLILEGNRGVKRLLKPILNYKFNIVWYLFCLFSTAFLSFTAIGISFSLGFSDFTFNELSKIYLVIPVFLFVLFFSVLGEETGWRGFALKKMLEKMNPIYSSIIIGVIWGFWHLPLFFIEGNFHQLIPFWLFLVQEIALSIVITFIYIKTKKSLLSTHLFHAASNTTLGVLPILPMDTNNNLLPLYIIVILLIILAISIILSKGLKVEKENIFSNNNTFF